MPSSEKSKCCGAYVTRRFFMLCYNCACLMGVTLYCCTAVYVVVLVCSLIWSEIGTLEEILALRRVWITLRQQLHECLSPDKGELSGSC